MAAGILAHDLHRTIAGARYEIVVKLGISVGCESILFPVSILLSDRRPDRTAKKPYHAVYRAFPTCLNNH